MSIQESLPLSKECLEMEHKGKSDQILFKHEESQDIHNLSLKRSSMPEQNSDDSYKQTTKRISHESSKLRGLTKAMVKKYMVFLVSEDEQSIMFESVLELTEDRSLVDLVFCAIDCTNAISNSLGRTPNLTKNIDCYSIFEAKKNGFPKTDLPRTFFNSLSL